MSRYSCSKIRTKILHRSLDISTSQKAPKTASTKMSLEQKFKEAASAFKALLISPTEEEYAQCYALFKQGTVGDVNKPDPGTRERHEKMKWEAWKGKKGMSKEAAKEEYIKCVDALVKREDDD